jgi:hypothetical protein
MLNLFQHPGWSRLAGGELDPEQVQGDAGQFEQDGPTADAALNRY